MLAVILSAAKNLLFQGRWVILLAGLVVCGIFALTCHRETHAPLPAPIAARVQEHLVQSAVDSAAIKQLMKAAETEQIREDTAVARAQVEVDLGNYRVAYVQADSSLLAMDRQVALLDVALTKSESRAAQADSVIADVLPIAESREPLCRILWFIPCPTRRAVAVAAAGATAMAFILIPRTVHP